MHDPSENFRRDDYSTLSVGSYFLQQAFRRSMEFIDQVATGGVMCRISPIAPQELMHPGLRRRRLVYPFYASPVEQVKIPGRLIWRAKILCNGFSSPLSWIVEMGYPRVVDLGS